MGMPSDKRRSARRLGKQERARIKNRTKRRFLPNLHKHRFWVESEKRFVSLRVSTKGMRIIDKRGIDSVLADVRTRGDKV